MLKHEDGIEITENFDFFPLIYDRGDQNFKKIEETYYKQFKKNKKAKERLRAVAVKVHNMMINELDNSIYDLPYSIGNTLLADEELTEEGLSFRQFITKSLQKDVHSYDAARYIYYLGVLIING